MQKVKNISVLVAICLIIGVSISCRSKSNNDILIYPKQKSFVNDFEMLFQPAFIDSLNNYLLDIYMKDKFHVVVATLSFGDSITGDSFFNYTLNLARKWNIGFGEGKGALIAFNAGQRMWRVQLTNDLSEVITSNEIMEQFNPNVVSALKKGDYSSGIHEFVKSNVELIKMHTNEIPEN